MRTTLRAVSFGLLAVFFANGIGAGEVPRAKVTALVTEMTLEEKVGQLSLRGRGSSRSYAEIPAELVEAIRAGRVGALINIMLPEEVDRLQRIAVEESPHGVPLLFGRDVIHGLRAVAPIPLGQAATWDPDLVEAGARAAAVDASAYGINWTFAPMLDIARDPRWGRIAESFGEDPFLASRMAEAMVRGFQGQSPADPTSVAACIKHFAAYGAAEGGRDYNTVSMSEADLRNVYLPPFEAAIEAGALSVMSGFHELNGVPVTASRDLLQSILREEWGFDGFVVSDWNSVTEMIPHGFSEDARAAARQALTAGLDMEMMSTSFEDHLGSLVRAGEVPENLIDEAVARILEVKHRLGLFEEPYRVPAGDPALPAPASLGVARRLALDGTVLLRNRGDVLPIASSVERVAVIGPMADAPHEQLGTWSFDGMEEDTHTPLAALRERLGPEAVLYSPGLDFSRDTSRLGFAAAVEAARAADLVLFFGGEEAILSGEAHSRAHLALPGAQRELIRELAATDKPVVLALLAGRPLAVHDILADVDALLMAWHPGTMGGPALADLLLGDVSPSGRLPVSWPKAAGQIPIHYNHKSTGRPAPKDGLTSFEEIPVGAWQSSLSNTSRYLDLGTEPEFPFGFGLTYSTVEYSDLEVSKPSIELDGSIEIAATITNTGSRAVVEVVQLYIRDLVASRTRPVRELEAFQRISLQPGARLRVRFSLTTEALRFHDGDRWIVEPGRFDVWIAPDAVSGLHGSFELR